MELYNLDCPRCGSGEQFFLSHERDRHLRLCSGCDRWLLIHGGPSPADGSLEASVEVLGIEPECPVEGCARTPPRGALAEHIIENHGESPPLRPQG